MAERGSATERRAAERIEGELAAGRCRGAALAWGRGETAFGTVLAGAGGGGPVTAATRWDLASLTKVLATVPALLRLVAARELTLDARLGDLLPELAAAPAAGATVEQLLAHVSGLPAEAAPPTHAAPAPAASAHDDSPPDSALALVAAAPCERPATVRYSDVGFLALGAIVERLDGRPLAQALAAATVAPLGLRDTSFGSAPASRTVPTGAPLAGGPPRQRTHDPVARRLGGTGGHAGMFGSLRDVVALVQAWLADDAWIAPALRERAWRCHSGARPGGRRGLGWCLPGDDFHCARRGWAPSAVSHTGFTGTSVVLDPPTGAWCVLLTDLLPVGGDASAIVRLRLDVHELVGGVLASNGDTTTVG